MARYTGPRLRKMRALDCDLPGLSPKRAERRPYPPGQHGNNRRVKKASDYKRQLVERQKLRFNYGVTESQLRRIVLKARHMKGRADENILALLEGRLDNIVFRAGFAPTIPAARQLVVHGHILVDGKRLDRPAAHLKPGAELSVREASRGIPTLLSTWAAPKYERPNWLSVDAPSMKAKLTTTPDAQSCLLAVTTSLVIEHYASRV